MTLEQEIDHAVITSTDQIADQMSEAYQRGLACGSYAPKILFVKGVIWGAVVTFALVALAWAVGR